MAQLKSFKHTTEGRDTQFVAYWVPKEVRECVRACACVWGCMCGCGGACLLVVCSRGCVRARHGLPVPRPCPLRTTHHPTHPLPTNPLPPLPQLPEVEGDPAEATLAPSVLAREYEWVREYNSTVRYDPTERTNVFRFAPGAVTYAELGTRLLLRKRKRQTSSFEDDENFLQVRVCV